MTTNHRDPTKSPKNLDDAIAGGPRTRYEILWLLQQASRITPLKLTSGALRKLVGDGAADFDGALHWTMKQGLVRKVTEAGSKQDGQAYTLTPLGDIVAIAYRSGMVAVMRFQAGATGQDLLKPFREENPWMFLHDEPRDLENRDRATTALSELTGGSNVGR